ncbi:MAG: adhesin/invasin [Methanolobus sp.]|nr:adhesin/invasin [Methanolobus sp.]
MKSPLKFTCVSMILLSLSLSALALDIDLLTPDLHSKAGEPVNVLVKVTNGSVPENSTLVSFSSSLGMFSPSTAFTNTSGIAEALLNSTVAGMAQVNVSSGGAYELTNVTFSPLTASIILTYIDYPANVAGTITNISFRPVDIYGNINSSEPIHLEINLSGRSESLLLSLNGDNITTLELVPEGVDYVNWTVSERSAGHLSGSAVLSLNSTIAGNINIVSTTGSASNCTELLILPAEPSRIGAVYNECYTVNTTSSMYVRIYDMYNNPVPGVNLTFSVTSPESTAYNSPVGYNSASLAYYQGITSTSGQFANAFTTDKRAGANIVRIAVDNTSLQGNITITGTADEINNLLLVHTPELALSNNKDSYVLSARPVDQFLNPIVPLTTPIKELVRFTTSSGSSVLIPLNSQGRANTIVGPTPYVESLSLTATYRDASGYTNFTNSTTLHFVPGSLYAIDLYSVPNAVLAQGLNGNHEAAVSIVALDEWGHALPGVSVTLSNTNTTVGNLKANGISANPVSVTTDSNGRASALFTGNVSGNTTILAASGSINASTNISVKAEPFMSVILEVEPSNVTSGGTVNVTTLISIEGELPIIRPAASAMLVLDRSGSMDPDYYAGSPLDVVLVIDRSGSMAGQPIVDARNAAKDFIGNLVSNSKVGVVSFATSSTVDCGMTSLNAYDNRLPIYAKIDSLTATGYTAMGDGMADANNLLINSGRTGAKKVMVLLTDGETNRGSDPEDSIPVSNTNGIIIYTIGLGDVDESLLGYIASETGGKYYYTPDSSNLSAIYAAIAQELSDYDVSEIEYGEDGFTPYDFTFSGSISGSSSFQDTFTINETIDDLKVQLSWTNSASNLSLQLVSPSGEVYGAGHNTTGYYHSDTSEHIWIEPLSHFYSADLEGNVELGNWIVRVTGPVSGSEPFTISTYIDRKSAAKISSHAFISSFDESRGDKAGLALYSFENIVITDTQESYVFDNSSWVGYFTVPSTDRYSFDIFWEDSSPIGAYLFDGIDLLDSSNGMSSCRVSAVLYPGQTYRLDVIKGASSNIDTRFTVNASASPLDTIMAVYYDTGGGGGTPRFRIYDAAQWSLERSANYVGGNPYFVVVDSNPVRPEVIMLTGDSQNDVNAQIWGGISWGPVSELSTELNLNSRRGFDVKYEQISGDAVAVYMNRNINSGRIPRYQIWDGSSWSAAASVDGTDAGTGRVGWLKLASDPNSDNMTLVTQDDGGRIRAQVWNGDSWGNSVVITNDTNGAYQSFDVVYDNDGKAMVVWTDWSVSSSGFWLWTTYTCNVRAGYHVFNGDSWSSGNIGSFSYSSTGGSNPYSSYGCWVKAAADPGSNNALIALQDPYRIRAASWDGSSWSALSELQSSVQYPAVRSVDVSFEQLSGNGLVAWGGPSNSPRYRIWSGSSWSATGYASNVGAYPRYVKLAPDPVSNEIVLMTSDNNYDLNIQKWNGFSWGSVTEVETSSSRDYECFDLVFSSDGVSSESAPVSWSEWTASVTSTLQKDSISHLSNAIDTITADGLTAIDEGLFVANNELASVEGNSTIVLMTDGIDNAGYHSLLEEAYRAKANNTTIYTVGFGNTESEVDPILAEIAGITGGEYYFAPNSSVLKDIFRGIAMQITNFSAGGPVLDLHVPHNYVTPIAVAKVSYITGSSNATTGNLTVFDKPIAPGRGNAEPAIATSGNKRILEWQLPSLGPGDKWGIWYQMKVEGAGYVPLIMPTSTVTYTDLSGENITIYIPTAGGMSVGGGGGLGVMSYSLGELILVPDRSVLSVGESTGITLTLKDLEGNSSFGYVVLHSSLGSFDSRDSPGKVNPINITVIGSDSLNFTSQVAGKAYITAYATNFNNNSDMLNESELIIMRPKGMITIS